jgi:DNA repair photolyase
MTLDRKLQRVLEPLAASPRLRLRQLAALARAGIRTQVELGPLIPGLTDAKPDLQELLKRVAAAGIRSVTTGYAFLRERIQMNLLQALRSAGYPTDWLDAYQGGPVLPSDHIAPARYLPRKRRQQGYAALMALAAPLGIRVRVSSITNPDFLPPPAPEPLQRLLLPLGGP